MPEMAAVILKAAVSVLVLWILSIIPVHYLWGEIRGMETDGLKILNVMKGKKLQDSE